MACGTFSSAGGQGVADAGAAVDGAVEPDAGIPDVSPNPVDGSIADGPPGSTDTGPDGPTDFICSDDPLADSLFSPLPGNATCPSGDRFLRFCNLSMFGNTRSISFTTDEKRAVVVPDTGAGRAPFVIYERATASSAFGRVITSSQFPTTAYASFHRGVGTGTILYEIDGQNKGVGSVNVTFPTPPTSAPTTFELLPALPAKEPSAHHSHPYQLANKLYGAFYLDGPGAQLSLVTRSATWASVDVGSDGVGAGSPVVNAAETELFFRAANPFRLFRAERNSIKWMGAEALEVPASFGSVQGWQPQWLSEDGCRLYVTSIEGVSGVPVNTVRVLSRR
jgi:hypothetical protein